MVHSTGQGQGGWRRRLGRMGVAVIAALGLHLATAAPAAAQSSIGFQGGVSLDPEQVFGGVYWQSGDIGGGFRLRPGIDGATGEGFRIGTINLDFVYGLPLGGSQWTLLTGGGPSVVITRIPDFDFRDTSVGAHYLLGFGHESGFFTELRFGSGRAQQLKLGVGYAVTLD